MNKHLEQMRKDFQGSADDLIVSAQEVAKILNLDQEATEGNERLVRHYVSVGVVDKPTREGRDALYGFRHLVQLWLQDDYWPKASPWPRSPSSQVPFLPRR